jgi:hypothetical protein
MRTRLFRLGGTQDLGRETGCEVVQVLVGERIDAVA